MFSGDLGRKEGNKTLTLEGREEKVQPNPNWTGGGPCGGGRGAGGVGVARDNPTAFLSQKFLTSRRDWGGGRGWV